MSVGQQQVRHFGQLTQRLDNRWSFSEGQQPRHIRKSERPVHQRTFDNGKVWQAHHHDSCENMVRAVMRIDACHRTHNAEVILGNDLPA